MRGVTMRDIARRVGVSEATVSHVVNGNTSKVSAATRERVLQAIRELEYTPNRIARSLAVQSTSTIGLVVADVVRAPYAAAIKGVESVAMQHGYNVILCNLDGEDTRLENAVEVLLSKRVDGMVFVLSSRPVDRCMIERLAKRSGPIVFVNQPSELPGVPSVVIDNASGTFALTRKLAEMGHRRIGCIHLPLEGPAPVLAARERFQGYRDALACCGIAFDAAIVREGSFGEEAGVGAGERAARDLISLAEPPTALVCCNDYLAIGALRAIEAAGLRAPDDIAVVGHDDIPAAQYLRPALTSVSQPMTQAGEMGVRFLLERIAGEQGKPGKRGGPGKHGKPEQPGTPGKSASPSAAAEPVRLPCTPVLRASSGHAP